MGETAQQKQERTAELQNLNPTSSLAGRLYDSLAPPFLPSLPGPEERNRGSDTLKNRFAILINTNVLHFRQKWKQFENILENMRKHYCSKFSVENV